MKIIDSKRCIIGEGPIWNEKEQLLYFVNAMGGNEICKLNVATQEIQSIPVAVGVASMAFDRQNRLLVSRPDGVFLMLEDGSVTDLYDRDRYQITFANDGKVGPDGRFYVGTQSGKRKGVSDQIDGKLYSIDKDGTVRVLLDNLILSNGMEWNIEENKFYHADSGTRIIKEYDFDKETGNIHFTGRQVYVPGVDGFTIDQDNQLWIACWGKSHIAKVDTATMEVVDYLNLPGTTPASCGFCGQNMDQLVIVTASYRADLEKLPNSGFLFLEEMKIPGRKPYIFGA